MIITRTPFRLSFFGGGTDYPDWFRQHGGLVVGAAMQHYCYISCRSLPPFFEYKTRVVYSQSEMVNHPGEIKHPAIRGCLTHLGIEDGLEVHHDADLPARAGLGSSSAFTVGFLLSLLAWRGSPLPEARELADLAIKVEQEVIREHVGIQDQILAAHGGFQTIRIDQVGDYQMTPLVLSENYLQCLESHVLLGFTGLTRLAPTLAAEQVKRIRSGNSSMNEIQSMAEEGLKLFQAGKAMEEIGALLRENWKVKRTLAENMSSPVIDDLYARALKAGAYGGKLLGAGGGGFMMFLAPPELHEKIQAALPQVKVWVPFKVAPSGADIIFQKDERQHVFR
jgi:D-glycero-alpha-D-manno-heptose-7-phosphate kinase